ncbi:MAG: hypothetical protein KA474_09060 [Acinetobacter sp.]|nr:hypothetical protein [Acinetobacter sp.]
MNLDIFFQKLERNSKKYEAGSIYEFKLIIKHYENIINVVQNRTSEYLILQLFHAFCRGVTVGNILSEIGRLEGFSDIQTITKEETKFRGKLSGYWHKHFYSDSLKSFGRNNLGYLSPNFTDNSLKILRESIRDQTAISNNAFYEEEDISLILNRFMNNVFNSRKGQVTGDWIIFKKYSNRNYYVALSNHSDKDGGIYCEDKLLIQLDEICLNEFSYIIEK